MLLQPRQLLARPLELAEGDERLHVDGLAAIREQVAHAHGVRQLVHPGQRAIDLGVVSGRVLDERETRQQERLPPEDPRALGAIRRERTLEPSSMRVDDRADPEQSRPRPRGLELGDRLASLVDAPLGRIPVPGRERLGCSDLTPCRVVDSLAQRTRSGSRTIERDP